jgi:hypothetical protein
MAYFPFPYLDPFCNIKYQYVFSQVYSVDGFRAFFGITRLMPREILPVKIDDLHLSLKEQKAVAAYIANGYDAVGAVREAGLTPDNASPAMAKLAAAAFFNRPEVSQAIMRIEQAVLNPYRDRITQQIVQQKMIRATYDTAWFYDASGRAIPLDNIPVDRRWAIDDVQTQYYGKAADVKVVHYVLADKDRAQKELMEILKRGDDKSGQDISEKRKRLEDIFQPIGKGIGEGMVTAIDKMLQEKVDKANRDMIASQKKISRGLNVEEVSATVVSPAGNA